MANKFVWSGATGANDGSSWADAYTTLMKDWGAEAGFTPGTDFVYVRSTHNETGTVADLTITGTTAEGTLDPVRVLCVTGNDTGTDPGTLTTGATVNTNDTYDINIEEKIYIYGVSFVSGENFYIAYSSTDHAIKLEECVIKLGSSVANSLYFGRNAPQSISVDFINTDLEFTSVSQFIYLYVLRLNVIGGALTGTSPTNFIYTSVCYDVQATFYCFDSSVCTGNIISTVGGMDGTATIGFERCKLNASATLVSDTLDTAGNVIYFHHCQSGTDSDPAYQMKRYTYQGTVEVDAARYRTGGASDGERTNPFSWSMDTSAGSNVIELYEPLESPPIAAWTDGDGSTSHTYRIYVASGATLQDDECWVELIGPNSSDTSSLGERNTTRPDPMATPANLTTDSGSTWNGTDVGTKQYIDVSYTPDKPGPIEARIYLAKPSERVSVDPKIYIDPS